MTDSETLAMWLRRCALVRARRRAQRVLAMRAERAISDGHHDSTRSTEPDPIVADTSL